MKLEDQVCSLELAKRLKELGVKQVSYFHHVWFSGFHPEGIDGHYTIVSAQELDASPPGKFDYEVSAFTVAELGELLPYIIHTKDNEYLVITYKRKDDFLCQAGLLQSRIADTEANARAAMLVYLLENKLI